MGKQYHSLDITGLTYGVIDNGNVIYIEFIAPDGNNSSEYIFSQDISFLDLNDEISVGSPMKASNSNPSLIGLEWETEYVILVYQMEENDSIYINSKRIVKINIPQDEDFVIPSPSTPSTPSTPNIQLEGLEELVLKNEKRSEPNISLGKKIFSSGIKNISASLFRVDQHHEHDDHDMAHNRMHIIKLNDTPEPNGFFKGFGSDGSNSPHFLVNGQQKKVLVHLLGLDASHLDSDGVFTKESDSGDFVSLHLTDGRTDNEAETAELIFEPMVPIGGSSGTEDHYYVTSVHLIV